MRKNWKSLGPAVALVAAWGCTNAGLPVTDRASPPASVPDDASRFAPRPGYDRTTLRTDMPDDHVRTADGAVITSSAHPDCDDPAPDTGAFRDGLPGSGIAFVQASFPPPRNGRIDDLLLARFYVSAIAGGGVAAADLDSDGRTDLLFAQGIGPNQLYWGERDGDFVLASGTGLELSDKLAAGVSTADYDGDDRPDVLIFGLDFIALLRNLGDGTFDDVTDSMGLEAAAGWTTGAAWADIDQDGDLDLLLAGYAETLLGQGIPLVTAETRLWRNDHGTFTDITDTLPSAAVHGAALLATFRDFDSDGDPDLLLTHDFGDWGENTVLLENLGSRRGEAPQWIDRFASSGVGTVRAPMGAAVRDLNDDGRIDLWFSDLGGTRPLQATGPFTFMDTSLSWGLRVDDEADDVSWSVVSVDLGGWGRPGLYLAYGPLPPTYRATPTASSLPDRWLSARSTRGGELAFERSDEVFPDGPAGNSRGVAVGDLDRNGVPDLLVGRIDEPPALLMGRCTDGNRLVVELDDRRFSNRRAIGAVVQVRAGGVTRARTVDAGGLGTMSGSEPILFFGLGNRPRVDELSVRWPDGREDRFQSVCAHCRVRVRRD